VTVPSIRDEALHVRTRREGPDAWLAALQQTSRIGEKPYRLLSHVVDDMALLRGDGSALIGEGEALSYRELASRQHRYAQWALSEGLGKGSTVCLLMKSRPEYLAIWLGLTRVGATVALLNTNLAGVSLAHCIDLAAPSHMIVTADLLEAAEDASRHLSGSPQIWVHGTGTRHSRIDLAVDALDSRAPETGADGAVTLSDRALLIYTSGTTGLPKAANVSHHRVMTWSHWFAGLMATGPSDRMYDCLPLYHSIGGVVAVGSLLVSGGSVVIREKFSASRFWNDVVEHDCTLFQYIGELCRYLVNAPPHALERSHRLRLCAGNGLRGDVWESFQKRFDISRILEFYAATEGTASLYNVEGRIGAVGRIPPFMAHRFPAVIIKHDIESGEPVRDASGHCTRAAIGEAGELIGRLASDPAQAAQRFEGYTNKADSARKVLRDVFAPGDTWLRTGDLMKKDEKGFFYFVDRIGDTFRWKGENVSTSEVAEAVSQAPGVTEATVYGVLIPGTEGRAGMAALAVAEHFDLARFRADLANRLPSYARPVFLRIRDRLDVTETFKQKKAALTAEGFDPGQTDDALFVDDPSGQAYRPIDRTIWTMIAEGRMRL
jgi:fatty-acyl-CoA synthase